MVRVTWTESKIMKGLHNAASELGIDRMPTSNELRSNKMSGLGAAITKTGGFHKWSEKSGLKRKVTESIWNDEVIKAELLKSISELQIDKMPSASDLVSIGRNDLHCAVSKSSKKYSGWSKELGLELKSSETKTGVVWESNIAKSLTRLGFGVQEMTSNHPYDLLIDGCVKVDVKVGKAHNHFGSRAHTFRTAKKFATCDIYICVALDEAGEVENYFVMPGAAIQVVTVNVGTNSKYNQYIDDWGLVEEFANFYKRIIL